MLNPTPRLSVSLFLAATVLMAISTVVAADPITVYTQPESDGLALRDWSASPIGMWTVASGTVLNGYHDGIWRRWELPVLQFPLSTFEGQEIVSASMHWYIHSATNATVRYNGGGNGVIQYANVISSLMTIESGITQGAGWRSFDVTDAIQHAIDNDFSWAVFNVALGNNNNNNISIAPYEDPQGNKPYLMVTLVPEPAAMSLLAAGALAVLRRRRK